MSLHSKMACNTSVSAAVAVLCHRATSPSRLCVLLCPWERDVTAGRDIPAEFQHLDAWQLLNGTAGERTSRSEAYQPGRRVAQELGGAPPRQTGNQQAGKLEQEACKTTEIPLT